ncbi:hypothetical protein R3P38DRAFT_81715 [Favolaschia claudopus]|uniref:RBR-type E3 ubiquitin transferase n=1 Tax=Favolaschia claudopus TaxID=2862362 RepID=A0AAW0D7E6_9AGAR
MLRNSLDSRPPLIVHLFLSSAEFSMKDLRISHFWSLARSHDSPKIMPKLGPSTRPLSKHSNRITHASVVSLAPLRVDCRMFKKYKAFMNNEGAFQQPGARALQDYLSTYNEQVQLKRAAQAVRTAQKRVAEAEEAACEAEARAVVAQLEARTSLSDTQSLVSKLSGETVTRERLFPERATPPAKPVPPPPRRDGSTCSICLACCLICPNPWQRTRSDLMVSEATDGESHKPSLYGIALKPCDHVFCGACLAKAIYHTLNLAFDKATYGTKLPSYARDALGPGRPEFPIFCPACQKENVRNCAEVNDTTARMVLGESNMDEWNHARFLATVCLLQCPQRDCDHTFDSDDAIPSKGFSRECIQCPRCKSAMCRTCRSVWHEDMTCLMYQALPHEEEPPVDVRQRRHGWAPNLHTFP